MLPDKVPLEIYAMVAGPLDWDPALVRAISRQETWLADENPNWIRLEAAKWRMFRMASREAQSFDSAKVGKSIADRWAQFEKMDAVCAEDALVNRRARDAAMLSHSVGFGQIMGFNHKFCGFETVGAWWQAMKSLEGQAMAMVAFVRSSPRLLELGRRLDLRPRKWTDKKMFRLGDLSEISSIYNGVGFEKNDHDRGLQTHLAFARKEAASVRVA